MIADVVVRRDGDPEVKIGHALMGSQKGSLLQMRTRWTTAPGIGTAARALASMPSSAALLMRAMSAKVKVERKLTIWRDHGEVSSSFSRRATSNVMTFSFCDTIASCA